CAMPRIFRRSAGPCVFLAALAASFWLTRPAAYIRAEDRDHDGRPDLWRVFDRQGNLARVAVDTHADGRSDVQEYYEHGALVRRESDRDFNDRVDLIQEFDADTAESVRSVEDVDFDGTADVLLLYSHGQPIVAKWATVQAHTSQSGPPRAASDELAT